MKLWLKKIRWSISVVKTKPLGFSLQWDTHKTMIKWDKPLMLDQKICWSHSSVQRILHTHMNFNPYSIVNIKEISIHDKTNHSAFTNNLLNCPVNEWQNLFSFVRFSKQTKFLFTGDSNPLWILWTACNYCVWGYCKSYKGYCK